MELTVYRQASKTRPDGTVVYKGEDTLPYVGKKLFFVADGLGGAAAIRHQNFDKALFEEEGLLDTLFKGVYEEYSDGEFEDYVKKAFYELRAVKDCYEDNVNNMKKSGYFASRLVSCILLHEFIYNEGIDPEKIFGRVAELSEDKEKLSEWLGRTGDKLAALIRDRLRQLAAKVNLTYESSYSGLALLGTTLCATLYLEGEDCVETLYMTAGDSRPYVWNETEGLCQLLADEEGKDGGMTNYIRANDDAEFHIRCNYFKFPKPCVLFNASDGCFDSGFFLSQMAFEELITKSAVESADTAELSDKLTEFFLRCGRHDDSSTIAMKMFGYDSFETFKAACARRYSVICEKYLGKLPELLEKDFAAELAEKSRGKRDEEPEIIDRFWDVPAVKARCESDVKEGRYPPYLDEVKAIEDKISNINKAIGKVQEAVAEIITCNFSKFQPLLSEGYRPAEKQPEDPTAELKSCRDQLQVYAESIKGLLENIYAAGTPSEEDLDADSESLEIIGECETIMNGLTDRFSELCAVKAEAIKRLVNARKQYVEDNRRLAQEHPEELEQLTELIMTHPTPVDVSSLGLPEDELEELLNQLGLLRGSYEGIELLEGTDKVQALEKAVSFYWHENKKEIVDDMVSEHPDGLPEDLVAELMAVREGSDGDKELRENAALQEELFSEYEKTYSKYMEVSE